MSTDPSAPKFTPIPVDGAESAPAGYVDYFYWQTHPPHLTSLTLGRYVVLPPDVQTDGSPPEPAAMRVKVSFVAHMTPAMLRSLRYSIDQALTVLEPPPTPEDSG